MSINEPQISAPGVKQFLFKQIASMIENEKLTSSQEMELILHDGTIVEFVMGFRISAVTDRDGHKQVVSACIEL